MPGRHRVNSTGIGGVLATLTNCPAKVSRHKKDANKGTEISKLNHATKNDKQTEREGDINVCDLSSTGSHSSSPQKFPNMLLSWSRPSLGSCNEEESDVSVLSSSLNSFPESGMESFIETDDEESEGSHSIRSEDLSSVMSRSSSNKNADESEFDDVEVWSPDEPDDTSCAGSDESNQSDVSEEYKPDDETETEDECESDFDKSSNDDIIEYVRKKVFPETSSVNTGTKVKNNSSMNIPTNTINESFSTDSDGSCIAEAEVIQDSDDDNDAQSIIEELSALKLTSDFALTKSSVCDKINNHDDSSHVLISSFDDLNAATLNTNIEEGNALFKENGVQVSDTSVTKPCEFESHISTDSNTSSSPMKASHTSIESNSSTLSTRASQVSPTRLIELTNLYDTSSSISANISKEPVETSIDKQVSTSTDKIVNKQYDQTRVTVNTLHANSHNANTTSICAQQSRLKESRTIGLRREGSVKSGKWKLGNKLGSGAFGVVHVGMNTATGKLMAVKILQMEKGGLKDARGEIELLKALNHKNIVRYYGAELDCDQLYIFQEWVAGGSVAEMLKKFGPFSSEVVQSYLQQVLVGLEFLHERNIIHRDIKGSNILVTDDGVVKLADFGASKKLSQFQNNMMVSLTMKGTPYFMAPEVFEEKYSNRADIWSIGCLGIQMVTAEPPFKDKKLTNPVSLFNYIKKLEGAPEFIYPSYWDSTQKKELYSSLIQKCFHLNPQMRPSANDLLTEQFFSFFENDDADCSDHSILFSPCNSLASSNLLSPAFRSSFSPQVIKSANRISQNRSPFLSPPLPVSARERNHDQLTSSPNCWKARQALHISPPTDTSLWPSWAKVKLRDAQSASNSNVVERKLVDTIESLAFSDDTVGSENYKRKSSLSTLEGLKFVEK